MNDIHWQETHAAIWRSHTAKLRAISRYDPITLEQLLGIDRQKQALCSNTERFLQGKPANNALLWGSRGTGKSALIKALLKEYQQSGLRMIEIDRDDLGYLPEIVDEIRDLPYHFIVFCDDLSFEDGDSRYKALKSVLEGSLELPPDNVLIYASSNRRHLLPETREDNQAAKVIGTELHLGDAIEEKISLSDRFGLWLSFYPINQQEYLNIVDSYFPGWNGNREQLHLEAKQFAQTRGIRSGRTAKQFFKTFS